MTEISIKWHTDDVLYLRPDLTEDQADDVLLTAKVQHDCTVGINFDVLRTLANEMYPQGGE